MADAPTPEALAAQAFIAIAPVFDPGVFAGAVFDSQDHSKMCDPVTRVPYAEIALRYSMDPTDAYEVARAAGGQGSIRGTLGLTAAEIAAYPFGSHDPRL